MSNPSVGINPYLEIRRLWGDSHHRLITYIRSALQTQIRPRHVARIEERVYVEDTRREIAPDVVVMRTQTRTAALWLEKPYDPPQILRMEEDTHTQGFMQIYDHEQEMRLITVIEVFSPTNKEPNTQGMRCICVSKRRSSKVRCT